MRDQEGFHILTRTGTTSSKKVSDYLKEAKSKEKDSKPKNPFKKGSWKHYFWREMKRHTSSKFIQFFHNVNFRNFIIWTEDKRDGWMARVVHHRIDKITQKVLRDAESAEVLIGIGDRMYANITAKVYKKLSKINKVAFHFDLEAWDDSMCDTVTITEDYVTIDNINDLLSYINYHRQCAYGIYEIQAKCSGFEEFYFNFRILVEFRNGTCKTYKGDLNEFLRDFDIYQL